MADTFGSLATALFSSFTLVSLAEIGDKSQLVCIALSARYRAMPVLAGVVFAFSLLNALAVAFGTVVAKAVSPQILAVVVALLFIGFGVHALRGEDDDEEVEIKPAKNHRIFVTAFLLIVMAEFGDKTQLSVAAISSVMNPLAVWLGSTLALLATSAAAVLLGQLLLKRFDLALIHKASGVLFLVFGILTLAASFW